MDDLFVNSAWLGSIIWIGAFILNALSAIVAVRLYANGAEQHIAFEETGSPLMAGASSKFWLEPGFLAALLVAPPALAFLHWAALDVGYFNVYLVGLGIVLLVFPPLYLRNLRNIFLFRVVAAGHISGRISYPRWVSAHLSAVEFVSFAAAFALAFALTTSWFLLGGAISCSFTALKHWAMSKKLRPRATSPDAA